MPKFTLNQFRKSEETCFLKITDLKKDLKIAEGGKITTWVSRSENKKNAEAVAASGSYRAISKTRPPKQWGLNFNNSLYVIKGISLSSGLACVTFKLGFFGLAEELSSEESEQFIFGDEYRGVSSTGKHIYIYGVNNSSNKIAIKYTTPVDTWNTVLVQWLPDVGEQGMYKINDSNSATFSCNQQKYLEKIELGGRGNSSLKGSIAIFEVYSHWKEIVPDVMINLIMRDHDI